MRRGRHRSRSLALFSGPCLGAAARSPGGQGRLAARPAWGVRGGSWHRAGSGGGGSSAPPSGEEGGCRGGGDGRPLPAPAGGRWALPAAVPRRRRGRLSAPGGRGLLRTGRGGQGTAAGGAARPQRGECGSPQVARRRQRGRFRERECGGGPGGEVTVAARAFVRRRLRSRLPELGTAAVPGRGGGRRPRAERCAAGPRRTSPAALALWRPLRSAPHRRLGRPSLRVTPPPLACATLAGSASVTRGAAHRPRNAAAFPGRPAGRSYLKLRYLKPPLLLYRPPRIVSARSFHPSGRSGCNAKVNRVGKYRAVRARKAPPRQGATSAAASPGPAPLHGGAPCSSWPCAPRGACGWRRFPGRAAEAFSDPVLSLEKLWMV
nr:collagen alpha-1(I) chain-like [Taeniopygia guttata]